MQFTVTPYNYVRSCALGCGSIKLCASACVYVRVHALGYCHYATNKSRHASDGVPSAQLESFALAALGG